MTYREFNRSPWVARAILIEDVLIQGMHDGARFDAWIWLVSSEMESADEWFSWGLSDTCDDETCDEMIAHVADHASLVDVLLVYGGQPWSNIDEEAVYDLSEVQGALRKKVIGDTAFLENLLSLSRSEIIALRDSEERDFIRRVGL